MADQPRGFFKNLEFTIPAAELPYSRQSAADGGDLQAEAKAVFTGYKFSGLLQLFMVDYALKTRGNYPLSDEVKSNAARPY